MSETLTYSQALSLATRRLQSSSSSAYVDAQALLCHALGCNSAHLAAWPERELSQQQSQRYDELVSQRASGTPVAYLTGHREFWSLELEVTKATLIPRPETETLVEFVLEKFDNQQLALVDLGTGSGAIAIAIASERPGWTITATDIAEKALAVARSNAGRLQLENISFTTGSWFENLARQHFDIIVSNPPYIAGNDPHLSGGDVAHEPVTALASGRLGMDDIEHITSHAPGYLKPGGWLIVEHGYNQEILVQECFTAAGFECIVTRKDLSGQPRMTAGCAPSR